MKIEEKLAIIEATYKPIGIGLARQYGAGMIDSETYWRGIDSIELACKQRKDEVIKELGQRELTQEAKEKYREKRRLERMGLSR